MEQPIRCIECYKNRPGGRCNFCPLHKKNNDLYIPLGNGWFLPKPKKQTDSLSKDQD